MRWREAVGSGVLAGLLVVAGPAGTVGAAPRDGHYWVDQLGFRRAWQVSQGAGVAVGVLDTGVNADRPGLAGAVLPGRAFPDLGDGVRDARGHGTTVAMLIAGRGHGNEPPGAAPRATIVPAVAAGGSATVNEAIRWLVDQRVSVINLSLGRGSSTTAYDDALRYAARHDVVVVAAAGNAGQDRAVVSPADRPGVLAVGAVDRQGAFRPEVSVAGPQVALTAPGVGIATAVEGQLPGDGTSYAAAIVSGVVALVRSRFPGLDAANVVQRMVTTARPAGQPGRDPQYGYGIVDPVAALTASVPSTAVNPLGSLLPGTAADRSGQAPRRSMERLATVLAGALLGLTVVGATIGLVVRRTRRKRNRSGPAARPVVRYGRRGRRP